MPNHSTQQKRNLAALAGILTLLAGGCRLGPSRAPETPATPAAPPPAVADAASVIRNPTDLPAALGDRAPTTVMVNLETVEVTGKLADGTTYNYWTFGGRLPGPMVRARVGDTIELHLKNNPKSNNVHSIDLHAVSGPGGGSVAMQVKPGEERVMRFRASNPGLFIYHCASPHIPTHIAMGMYGLMLVEPAGGLPKVDREFYVVQGEVYSEGARGTQGHLGFDSEKMFHEDPNFVVFNGQAKGLAGDPNIMKAKRGETIRIFFGNAGPNLTSNFHVIGEIFDRVYAEGGSEVIRNIGTTLVPSGGAAMVEFTPDVPGRYILVDHAISRAIDKGAIGYIDVEGAANPAEFDPVSGIEQGVSH